jgi:hypothetical protein
MTIIRHLVVVIITVAMAAVPAHAQSPGSPFRIDTSQYSLQQTPSSVPSQMHPVAKGALIGAAVGAGTWLGIGLWYCTIGPNEAGECSSTSTWLGGIPLFAGAGAALGALIGAMKR